MAEGNQSYEQSLAQHVFKKNAEKTFVDKVLNRQDNQRINELMKKKDLSEDDIHEILHLVSTINNKLANFDDWDRYLLGKDFAWIREFATHCVSVLNWETELKNKKKDLEKFLFDSPNDKDLTHEDIAKRIDKNIISNEKELKRYNVIMETIETVTRIQKETVSNFKFMVDVFNYLSSSTLSLSGAAFDKLTTSRFEYHYPGMENQNMMNQPSSTSRFNFNMRR